jgi:thymidylate kinase/thymidylate synthase ThyX
MQNRPGTFIVIEGTDGSGKATQFELLCDRLRQAGYDVATFDFPQYNQPSSYFVKQYLNGEYGSSGEVGPYTASLFYALDRYEAAPEIKKALDAGKIIVSNRFTGSSMGHQGTKFRSPEERRGYFIWLDNLEFEMLQIPRPDISFVLRVPAEIAQEQVDKKAPRKYTDKKRDIHEEDLAHLQKSVEVYDDLTQLFPKDFQRVDCVRNDKLLDVDTIQNMLWEKITPLLPPPPQLEASSKDIPSAAADPAPAVSQAVSESEKPASLIREVTGQHFVVEQASHLLAQRLERSQLAAHLDESTSSTDYRQKDTEGNYKYYMPKNFSALTTQQYHASMIQIFDLYTEIVAALEVYLAERSETPKEARDDAWKAALRAEACRAANPVLPAATKSNVAVLAFGQALEGLVVSLLSDELPEARDAGEHILRETRVIAPAFLERGEDAIVYRADTHKAVSRLAKEFLPENHAAETTPVRLSDVWPRNELELLPDMLYEFSSLPLADLRREIEAWPYSRKLDMFEAYIGQRQNRSQRPGDAFSKARYGWDLVSDYGSFRDLQRHRLAGDPEWQQLTPRYGYEVPQLIDNAGLSDQFERCFDLSLALYSLLQQAGHELEAQYATLLGHKMRWKVTYSASEAFRLHELGAQLDGHDSYRKLMQRMHDKLTETHPLVAEAMKFVGPQTTTQQEITLP